MLDVDLLVLRNVPGLTEAVAAFMDEACAMCMESQGHATGVIMRLQGIRDCDCSVHWGASVEDRTLRAHGDPEVSTEYGAYAIALAIVPSLTPYTAVERSAKGPGFDYWLSPQRDLGDQIFAHAARLEVSGIRNDPAGVPSRVASKMRQTSPSDSTGTPAIIAVVEFSQPLAVVKERKP